MIRHLTLFALPVLLVIGARGGLTTLMIILSALSSTSSEPFRFQVRPGSLQE